MDIWQIVVIVVLAALILVWVAVIAYNKGRVSGRLAAEQDLSGDEDTHSLFGDDAPVRPTERRLIEVLPEALIVTDRNGLVQYSSPGSVPFGLVSGDRLNSREVEDILTQAAADGGMREREVQLPVNRNSYPSSNGRGLEAGQSRPSNTLYLRVRIGDIGDDLYAIFINDMSEQRRFEAVRRDFVTNVSHELKTPAGAIALLAETVTDAADDPDAVRYFSGRISKESARLTELVHHLIDLQKAQSPQSVIDARRISALDVARAAIAANQTQADSRHVDEYDKPLLQALDNGELLDEYRNTLKAFYGVLKSADRYLRFVFLTGVTKFAQVSVFSDLNQLNDISLDFAYSTVCGITREELTTTFVPELKQLAEANDMTPEEAIEMMARKYDGYHFHPKGEGVFNPFSVLSSFSRLEFGKEKRT